MGWNLHWTIILASERQNPAARRHSGRAWGDPALVGWTRAFGPAARLLISLHRMGRSFLEEQSEGSVGRRQGAAPA